MMNFPKLTCYIDEMFLFLFKLQGNLGLVLFPNINVGIFIKFINGNSIFLIRAFY